MSVRTVGKYVMQVPGSLDDRDCTAFLDELRKALKDRPREVILDCSQIEYASPSHVSTICLAHAECLHAGVALSMSSLKRSLKRVLTSLDLYDYLIRDGNTAHTESTDNIATQLQDRSPELHIEFRPTAQGVHDAMAELNTYLRNSGSAEVESLEIETAFYEIATNVRLHSQPGPESVASVAVFEVEDGIILKFVDSRPPFDPTREQVRFDPANAIKNGQRRRIGLAMVKRLVDALYYERENGRFNVLYLKKRISIREGQTHDHSRDS